MIAPAVWLIFLFALGACVGSFLNVVVYRRPAGLSLVTPGSRCGSCGVAIRWYDNIPILSWFFLRGRCRACGARFSIRYALVELVTALIFAGLYAAYFIYDLRRGMPAFEAGGWSIYAGHVALLSILLASSLIDADYMVIDLAICRLGLLIGLVLSALWPYLPALDTAAWGRLTPYAGGRAGAAAVGVALGLAVSQALIWRKVFRRSYAELEEAEAAARAAGQDIEAAVEAVPINIYRVIGREVLYLLPPLIGGVLAYRLLAGSDWWAQTLVNQRWLGGLLGSAWGVIVGAGVVWATRILGTLLFRREAMGSGDIDLMATVGAVLGWISPTLAFFIAPFIGLGWAILRLITHRTREIPYGPFLSMATLVVMILHDPLVDYFLRALRPGELGP